MSPIDFPPPRGAIGAQLAPGLRVSVSERDVDQDLRLSAAGDASLGCLMAAASNRAMSIIALHEIFDSDPEIDQY
jgi:hypothetical protein